MVHSLSDPVSNVLEGQLQIVGSSPLLKSQVLSNLWFLPVGLPPFRTWKQESTKESPDEGWTTNPLSGKGSRFDKERTKL